MTISGAAMLADRPLDVVLSALRMRRGMPRQTAKGWRAICPGHKDRVASLQLSEGDDGRALVCCMAGCRVEDVVAALGLHMADLFVRTNGRNGDGSGSRREVAAYSYTDEAGTVLYQKVRTEPKDFFYRRPSGAGGWTLGLGDTRRVLYNLPAVLATVADGGIIYVAEGEKDCDAINALEDGAFAATCNPEGANKDTQKPKWKAEYSAVLRGAHVVVIQDKDDAGRAHARAIAESLKAHDARSVRIVEARAGKDAADHLAAGFTLDQLVPVGEPAPSAVAPLPPPATPGDATLESTVAVFQRWLHLPDPDPLYAVLGTIAANRLPGDPVWLLDVGGSSWGKSELHR
jgi:putative DNA primase/helicase